MILFDPMNPDFSDKVMLKIIGQNYTMIHFILSLPMPLVGVGGGFIQLIIFINSTHEENIVTQRSHVGVVIFNGGSPIIWHLRQKNTLYSENFVQTFRV